MNPPAGKLIVTTATMECLMCPTIIVGITDDGCAVYCRYRWGRLSVRIDPRDPPPHGGAAGRWILDQQIDPNGLDGDMSYEQLQELTADLIEWPAELSPRPIDDEDSWLEI